MAGRKRLDPVSEAAMDVVNVQRQREEVAKQEQADVAARLAECHQVIGRVQATKMLSKFGNVSELMWIKGVKDSEIYKGLPGFETWEKFCNSVGYTAHHINDQLRNLETFGAEFLETVSGLRVGYRDLRKLRQLSSDGTVTIDAEYAVIGDERIPLDPDHREDLQAAIENIIEQQAALKADIAAQKKAHDRVQDGNHKEITKLHKELDKLTAKAEAKGLTPEEDAFVQKCEAARITIQGYLDQFDPSINPLPDDATPRMKAALMHTLAWFQRCIRASYDTAGDLYGDAELDGGWVPPHLRGDDAAELLSHRQAVPAPAADGDCSLCSFRDISGSADGLKLAGGLGNCTRPGGYCAGPETPETGAEA